MNVESEIKPLINRLNTTLNEIVKQLEGKVNVIYILHGDWTQRNPDYEEYHGFLLPEEEHRELYSIVRKLLDIAEYQYNSLEVYATIEDGITLSWFEDVENQYGRTVGTNYYCLPLLFIIERAKEKAEEYSISKLKESLTKMLSEL